jgi:hypothetical protein
VLTLAEILAAIVSGALVGSATIYAALAAIGIIPPQQGMTVSQLTAFIRALIASGTGGPGMACATTHSTTTKAQGPGVCCAALSAAGYGPGNPPPIGTRVAAQNRLGNCIVCQVSASTSRKHPGVPVIRRGKSFVAGSAVSCPTSSGGCCALVGQ